MRKFVIKLIIALLIVSTCLFFVNKFYVSVYSGDDVDKFKHVPKHIDVCNIGNSHGYYAFDYSEYEDKYSCFNFAIPAQVYYYDYNILMQYSSSIGDGTYVIIPVSYISLYAYDADKDSFESQNRTYYKFLDKKYIIDYDWWTDICEAKLPVLVAYDKLFDDVKDSIVGDGNNDLMFENEKDWKYMAKVKYEKQIENCRIGDEEYYYNKKREKALYDIIDYVKSKGAIPILMTTPLEGTYLDYIKEKSPEFFDEFYNKIDAICVEKDVKYFDYSMDERLIRNTDNFRDSDHMNESGGKQFTRIFMEEVIETYDKRN